MNNIWKRKPEQIKMGGENVSTSTEYKVAFDQSEKSKISWDEFFLRFKELLVVYKDIKNTKNEE